MPCLSLHAIISEKIDVERQGKASGQHSDGVALAHSLPHLLAPCNPGNRCLGNHVGQDSETHSGNDGHGPELSGAVNSRQGYHDCVNIRQS